MFFFSKYYLKSSHFIFENIEISEENSCNYTSNRKSMKKSIVRNIKFVIFIWSYKLDLNYAISAIRCDICIKFGHENANLNNYK